MGLIKEPLAVDFIVDSRPLTDKEKKLLSDFIKADKQKRAKQKLPRTKTITRKKNLN